MLFSKLKYLIIDVDGTLTDGGVYYDESGNELKKFNTRDAAGIFAVRKIGIKVIILTGRECQATKRRMKELKVDFIFQNVKNKTTFLTEFMDKNKVYKDEIGYIGDDLNDYAPMQLAGFIGCPKDACKEIKEIAHCISNFNGGQGSVRDIIEQMLEKENCWKKIISDVYEIGI